MAFLLQLTGGTALQYALDTFFGTLHGGVVGLREVTKSAFSQARKKLKASAFISLNRFWTEQWHEKLDFQRWCGLRVVAGDGTCLRVPTWNENIIAYGWGSQKDGSVVMARCVVLFATATRQMGCFRETSTMQNQWVTFASKSSAHAEATDRSVKGAHRAGINKSIFRTG